jgi:hypothetical protein
MKCLTCYSETEAPSKIVIPDDDVIDLQAEVPAPVAASAAKVESDDSSSASDYDECEDSVDKIATMLKIGHWTKIFMRTPPYFDHKDDRYKITTSTLEWGSIIV